MTASTTPPAASLNTSVAASLATPVSASASEIDAGNDWLDDVLRDAGREYRADYIADDGFSQRLMGRLPEAATLPAWRRPAVALLWVLGVGAVMYALPGLFEQLFRAAMAALVGRRLGVPDVAVALFLFGGALWSALVYAIRSD